MSKDEHVIQLCASQHTGSVLALTSHGRMFERIRDPRNFDGRNPDKFIWREIDGPLENRG